MTTIMTVKSRAESFRRAGIAFTRSGVDVDVTAITEEQLAAIENEPALIVTPKAVAAEEGEAEPKKSSPKSTKGGK